jgi:hypothetical protein
MKLPNFTLALAKFDITQIFKDKRLKWSAKRTTSGLIVITACQQIVENTATWENVLLCCIGILPLCLSFFEKKDVDCKCKCK